MKHEILEEVCRVREEGVLQAVPGLSRFRALWHQPAAGRPEFDPAAWRCAGGERRHGLGKPCDARPLAQGRRLGRNRARRGKDFGWDHAQINHYMVRTRDFFALKRLRGRGYKAAATGEANLRHTDEFFRANDRNEAEDRSILRWQDAVTQEIARLMDRPEVAEAVESASAKVKDVMSQVAPPPADPAQSPDAAPKPKVQFKLTFPQQERDYVVRAYADAKVILVITKYLAQSRHCCRIFFGANQRHFLRHAQKNRALAVVTAPTPIHQFENA